MHHHEHHSSSASSSSPGKDCVPSSSQQEHCSIHCTHGHKLKGTADICNVVDFEKVTDQGRAERLQAYFASKYSEHLAYSLAPKQFLSMKAAQQFRILEAVPCVHSQTELAKQSQKQLKRILKLEQPLSKAEQIKRDAKMLEDLVDTFKAKGYDNTKANAKANKFMQESFGRYWQTS